MTDLWCTWYQSNEEQRANLQFRQVFSHTRKDRVTKPTLKPHRLIPLSRRRALLLTLSKIFASVHNVINGLGDSSRTRQLYLACSGLEEHHAAFVSRDLVHLYNPVKENLFSQNRCCRFRLATSCACLIPRTRRLCQRAAKIQTIVTYSAGS